ncbi:MAG TPA: glycosyltransferase [Verrucomicrobiae bacterium]
MVSTHGYVASQPRPGAADTGGQVVYVLELSKKLAQLGYQVDIWTRQFADQPEIEIVDAQVRIVRMPCGGRDFIPKEFLCEYLQEWNDHALKFIQEHQLKYEFINSHYWDGGLAGDYLSRALGVPHIHTPHSLGIWKRRQSEADSAGRAAQTRLDDEYNFTKRIASELSLYVSVDMIVATSPEQQGILVCDYRVPAEKCRMIPPGYDETRFFDVADPARAATRKQLGFDAPVIQAIGRLADNKGYELLIKAFAIVARQMPEAILYLAVGDKTLTPQETTIFVRLRTLVSELDLTRRVRFGSFIPEDQLADYYRAADVIVLSSRYEAFGMSAVEAMACGTPAVLTVHGGMYHTVKLGKHGFYADPCDPKELGNMILEALENAGPRVELSRLGAEKARSLFTWNGVAKQLLALRAGRDGR